MDRRPNSCPLPFCKVEGCHSVSASTVYQLLHQQKKNKRNNPSIKAHKSVTYFQVLIQLHPTLIQDCWHGVLTKMFELK